MAGGDWRTRLHLSEAAANAAGYDQELKDAIRDAVFAHARLAKPAVNSKTLIQGLHHVLEMVRADSLTDGLTGVANRRRFDQVLEMETAEAAKSGDPLCLALADVDHFKRFNGTFGRQTGDQVLRVLTQTLKMNIQGGDHLSRYGGEEFALLLPGTALADAVKLADKLRETIKACALVQMSSETELSKLTLSVGVAVYQPGEPLQAFVQRADRCLCRQARRTRPVECGNLSVAG